MSANGRLKDSELRPIAGGGRLTPDAAAAWNAMAQHIYARSGTKIAPNGSDSSYRPIERQEYWRRYWCNQGKCENAAQPGTSNHGWGLAVDTDDHAAINEYGAQFGWQKKWSDAAHEPWHFKYRSGIYKGPDPGPTYEKRDKVADKLERKIDRGKASKAKKKRKVSRLRKAIGKVSRRIARWRKRLKSRRRR